MTDIIRDVHPQPCTRPGCRRCTPSPPPDAPPIKANPHNAATQPERSKPRTMIEPDVLADRLEHLARILHSPQGAKAWDRVKDWSDPGPMPTHSTPPQPGDDDYDPEMVEARRFLPGASDRREDWLEDRLVGRYQKSLGKIAEDLSSLARKVERIVEIATPGRQRHLSDVHLLRAQVAAEGCCVSCWADDKTLKSVELQRREGAPDVPYYKDLCRWCGQWKAEHGFLPPVWLLAKRRIRGPRSITQADADRAVSDHVRKTTKGKR